MYVHLFDTLTALSYSFLFFHSFHVRVLNPANKALNCCLISKFREKSSHSEKRDECNNLGKAGNKTAAATDPQKYVSA